MINPYTHVLPARATPSSATAPITQNHAQRTEDQTTHPLSVAVNPKPHPRRISMDAGDSSPSPPPLASALTVSVAVAGRIPEAVTVAAPAPPHSALTLALPIQHPHPTTTVAAAAGREDAWSEGATSALIDAWGERYAGLSRGNLKQNHWQEIADAVAGRDGHAKAPKTEVQCKNRIDTLKKKYKSEKAKITSSWPFFARLDRLLGGSNVINNSISRTDKIPSGVPIRGPPPAVTPQFPQRHRSNQPASKILKQSSSESSRDSSDGMPPANGIGGDEEVERRVAGMRELTRTIVRFGEVYERVESSKMEQAMELEKQRLEFARELEVQRMQFFMRTQVELSGLKRRRGGGHCDFRSQQRRVGKGEGSSSSHYSHYNNGGDNNCW